MDYRDACVCGAVGGESHHFPCSLSLAGAAMAESRRFADSLDGALHDIDQATTILAHALGYPAHDGLPTHGDHTLVTLADEVAARIALLEGWEQGALETKDIQMGNPFQDPPESYPEPVSPEDLVEALEPEPLSNCHSCRHADGSECLVQDDAASSAVRAQPTPLVVLGAGHADSG